jgi:phage terminase small subunit
MTTEELIQLINTLPIATRMTVMGALQPTGEDLGYLKYGINPQQWIFAEEYLRSFDVLAAMQNAGYSENQARTLGPRFLRDAEYGGIQRYIAERIRASIMDEREYLLQLAIIARGIADSFLDIQEDGSATVNLNKAQQRGHLRLLKRMRFSKGGMIADVEFPDPLKAMELLGKAMGLLKDVNVNASWEEIARSKGLDPIELQSELERRTQAMVEQLRLQRLQAVSNG